MTSESMVKKTKKQCLFKNMIFQKYSRCRLFYKELVCLHNHFLNVNKHVRDLHILNKYLNISDDEAKYVSLKYPVINKLDETKVKNLIETVQELGYPKEILTKEPLLFSMLPVTLRFRYTVLKECGIKNVQPEHIVSYLPIIRQKTIGELKRTGCIPIHLNVENQLASYVTQWPTSLTTLIYGDVNKCSLFFLRLKIIQRYLELILDLSSDEFARGVKTYPTIKHRPLQSINETLTILQSQIMIPTHKIKANFYLIHLDPENLKNILYYLRTIGGIDVKEVIRMYPKIAAKNFTTLLEIKRVLEEYGIGNEAQRRCFDIYTLSPSTIRERLEKAKEMPEFQAFFNHPRFLKMIHYNTTAMKRLMTLYNHNKKCWSLNIISGSAEHYETFEKAPGDRLGKGKDLVFCISQSLEDTVAMSEIRKIIKRHPFWINIPVVQVKFAYQQLATEFTKEEIFQNCPILLYPWNKIRDVLRLCNGQKCENFHPLQEQLDVTKLNNLQKLSLVLYVLEKNHYFSGNGVWTEEKNKINI